MSSTVALSLISRYLALDQPPDEGILNHTPRRPGAGLRILASLRCTLRPVVDMAYPRKPRQRIIPVGAVRAVEVRLRPVPDHTGTTVPFRTGKKGHALRSVKKGG